jgi:hypothetical protein
LHRADTRSLGLQGNRFDRFAFESAELSHHIAEKMVVWLTTSKTVSESGMEPTELIDKVLDIIESQLSNGGSSYRSPGVRQAGNMRSSPLWC